ncbi:bola protein [Gilbertella persicaria]|uniref:bola protein n=1 Tax=Gilbertella persicaria TaxID=101096 RepID=UPI002220CA2C|nr:bola protein [Gilbertella persicaria]KAI8087593.1 bola protein [Gilbertella persicaria]
MSTNSGITADSLKASIIERLEAQYVQVEDLSAGCGQMFEVIIVSPVFEGKRLLARHKLVNEALKEEISKVHAFTQKSYTPEEWEKKKAE